jgi:hypothetical protein
MNCIRRTISRRGVSREISETSRPRPGVGWEKPTHGVPREVRKIGTGTVRRELRSVLGNTLGFQQHARFYGSVGITVGFGRCAAEKRAVLAITFCSCK